MFLNTYVIDVPAPTPIKKYRKMYGPNRLLYNYLNVSKNHFNSPENYTFNEDII